MPIDYNPDKYVFRHHVIPETNEGLDIGRAGLRFGTIRAAACAIDSGTFQTVTASTLLLGVESVTSVLPTTSATGLVAVTNTGIPSVVARTITAGSSALTITNGDGVSGNPTIDIAALGVTNAMLAGGIDLTTKMTGVLPTARGGTGIAFFTAAGPTVARVYTFPDAAATVLTSNAAVTVAQGGTGLTSGTSGGILGYTAAGTLAASALLTTNALLLGGGAGATPTALGSLGTTTTVLHGNAAGAPTFGAVSLTADVSGILPVANGGTGVAFFTVAGPTVARTYTFPDAAATVLTSNTAVTVAQGGTGLTSGTSGGVLGYTATGTLASSALLTNQALMVGGGAGATPTTIAALTNGQLPIGSTGANPVPATLTAGANITITNAAGAITVAATGIGEGGTWSSTAKVKDTVYQNTSGKYRRVSIRGTTGNGANIARLDVGSGNPPTGSHGWFGTSAATGATTSGQLFSIVPNNWYYQVVTDTGTITVSAWFEMDE